MRSFWRGAALLCLTISGLTAHAVILFNPDTFEDGTVMGWGGGNPTNALVGSNHIMEVSAGTLGSRPFLASDNADARYLGNWLTAGATGVTADLTNVQGDPFQIHLLVFGTNGSRWETTTSYAISAGTGWVHATFNLSDLTLASGSGTLTAALSSVQQIQLRHNTHIQPGGESVNSIFGFDNVQVVPEPGTWAAFGLGAVALVRRKKK